VHEDMAGNRGAGGKQGQGNEDREHRGQAPCAARAAWRRLAGHTAVYAARHSTSSLRNTNSRAARELDVRHSFFHQPEPTRWESEGSFADPKAAVQQPSFESTHSLSDIVSTLPGAGFAWSSCPSFCS